MVTFASCVYDDSEKTHLIKNLASAFCQRDLDLSATADSPQLMAMEWALWQINNPTLPRSQFMDTYKRKLRAQIEYSLTSFRVDLVRLSCHFKSLHFASEKEWRLVLPHLRADQFQRIVLRTRNDRPYVDFSFEGYDKLPITSIRLGANADQEMLKRILEEAGYIVPFEKSKIPYRSFRTT